MLENGLDELSLNNNNASGQKNMKTNDEYLREIEEVFDRRFLSAKMTAILEKLDDVLEKGEKW